MIDWATWVAPVATMIAAMMTAANLGSRATGWGFVVFTIGSVLWSYIGVATGQNSLLITNGFLTVVNIFGVWRWLGRQAKFEDGSKHAAKSSVRADEPNLFSAASLIGRKTKDKNGSEIGRIVDAMLHCDGKDIAYLVVSDGGSVGVEETLRAVDPKDLLIQTDSLTYSGTGTQFEELEIIEPDNWPSSLD